MYTIREDDSDVMAVEHNEYTVYGVQFCQESIMTPDSLQMFENFLQ